MRLDLLPQAVPAIVGAVLAPWFYASCARGSMANRGARPIAFALALLATMLVSLAGTIRAVDLLVVFPKGLDDALDGVPLLSAAFIVPVIGFIAPRLLVALTGGADPSVPARYALTRALAWWAKADFSTERAQGVINSLTAQLSNLPLEFRTAESQSWVVRLSTVREAWMGGRLDEAQQGVNAMRDELFAVKPVEPLARIA